MLTKQILESQLEYNPETGIFINKITRARRSRKGLPAGSKEKTGYIRIIVNYKPYRAHRLAWLYMTGEFPKNMIDHINCDKSDNRFCNLREAAMSQNKFNQGEQSNNQSGHKGVSIHKQTGKWRARGNKNGKETHLGLFERKEDAIYAYVKFAESNHNEFLHIHTDQM